MRGRMLKLSLGIGASNSPTPGRTYFAIAWEGVLYEMPLILILIGNFFVFIFCLIGAQACYFRRSWKWFAVTMVCVTISGFCIFVELTEWLIPPPHEPAAYIRQPTTPL